MQYVWLLRKLNFGYKWLMYCQRISSYLFLLRNVNQFFQSYLSWVTVTSPFTLEMDTTNVFTSSPM